MAISEGDRHEAYLPRFRPPALDMNSLAAMMRRRASFVAAVTLACFGICLAWILLSPPKYLASGRVLLDLPESAGGVSATNALAVENQILVMTSRDVYDRVIAQERLESNPLFGGKPRSFLAALVSGLGLARSSDPHALALWQLGRSVSVTRNPGSSVVNVNAVSPDREMAARTANAVMDGYVADQAKTRGSATSGAADISRQRLETLQSRLRSAEQQYDAFRAQNLKPNGPAEKQVADLSAQVSAAEARTSASRSVLSQLQRAGKTLDSGRVPEMVRGGGLGAAGYRYADARQLELALSETLGPRHPDMIFARQRANETKRVLEQSIENRIQSATADLERARSSVAQLKGRLEASRKEVAISSETAARLKDLANDVEASRAAYQAVLTRSRETGGQQQVSVSNARIISRATAPLEPSGSFPAGILLVSLLLGLGLGVSLALLLELMAAETESVNAP